MQQLIYREGVTLVILVMLWSQIKNCRRTASSYLKTTKIGRCPSGGSWNRAVAVETVHAGRRPSDAFPIPKFHVTTALLPKSPGARPICDYARNKIKNCAVPVRF